MDELRRRILETSLDLFSKQGFNGTSINEISENAEVSEEVILEYFEGKEDLLNNLFSLLGPTAVKEEIERLLGEKINQPYEFLRVCVKEVIRELNDERAQKFLQIMLKEHNLGLIKEQIKNKFIEENQGVIVNIFQKMIEAGLIQKKDPFVLSRELIGPLLLLRIECLLLGFEDANREELSRMAEQHLEFFWESIKVA
jgi:AcrR family transcriptional regulator